MSIGDSYNGARFNHDEITMTNQPRRQHLITTAFRLFNEHGYHATGIDWILQESGVSKATLYKHFRSKEELILAVLEQRHAELVISTKRYIDDARTEGKTTVLAVFDALHDWFQSHTFFGCNFIKASGEYTQTNNVIHRYAADHKESLRASILQEIINADCAQAELLADQLMLLIEGAIVCAQVRGDKQSAQKAKATAIVLLTSAGVIEG